MEQYFRVGVITQTHGLQGEVKVFPTTSDTNRFLSLKRVYPVKVEHHTGLTKHQKEEVIINQEKYLDISNVKFFKQFVILKFHNINSINEVEQYRQYSLFVERKFAIVLDTDEFYVADLVGLNVTTDTGLEGTLVDVIETGANDVYVVDFPHQKQVLIPAIKECILDVNLENQTMLVHMLEGLL